MSVRQFLVGLLLLASALAVFKLATDPMAGTNMMSAVGEAVGGVAGGLILGLIVWIPFRFMRGAQNAPDIRRFTLYSAAILVVLFIVFRSFVGSR